MYFGIMVLARLTVGMLSSFLKPPTIAELPQVPIDAFNFCVIDAHLQLMLASNSVGTVFGTYLYTF